MKEEANAPCHMDPAGRQVEMEQTLEAAGPGI